MKPAPFGNCMFRTCDLPGQCLTEGKCHHPMHLPSDVDGMRAKIAASLHYPDCWDTAAYPTLEHAMHESLHSFACSECVAPIEDSSMALLRELASLKRYGKNGHPNRSEHIVTINLTTDLLERIDTLLKPERRDADPT